MKWIAAITKSGQIFFFFSEKKSKENEKSELSNILTCLKQKKQKTKKYRTKGKRGKKESYAWIDAPFQYVFLLWNYIFSMRFGWIEVVIVDRFFLYFPWQFFEAKLVPHFQMNDDNSQHERFVENLFFKHRTEKNKRIGWIVWHYWNIIEYQNLEKYSAFSDHGDRR